MIKDLTLICNGSSKLNSIDKIQTNVSIIPFIRLIFLVFLNLIIWTNLKGTDQSNLIRFEYKS